jgi:uncharacterized protein
MVDISRWLLMVILFSAGVLHLVRPELFDPAIPFDFKWEINLLVGLLEISLAFGLFSHQFRDLAARLTALWFLLLTPIHVYVSVKGIAMFGIADPLLLWGRTAFQAALYLWALSLQDLGWIISQRWRDVLFLHYEVDVEELQSKVPYPLDLFEGRAVVSIVPFVMDRIRFPFLPAVPGLSKLLELNLRTYVRVNDTPAVYFFTLDSNHWPGVLMARMLFGLPYRYRKMSLTHRGDYSFKSEQLSLQARVSETGITSSFDLWATERYALVTRRLGRNLLGLVKHPPWPLQAVHLESIHDGFSQHFIPLKNFLGASYAKKLDVSFRPFLILKSSVSKP